jgi:hypothetical protein
MRTALPLDTRCYQAALYLYPPAFRREYSGEIVRVFNEVRYETQVANPGGGLWAFRMRMGADLASTIVRQWLRSGWPCIVVMSILYPLTAASALARLWRRAPVLFPRVNSNSDLVLLILLTATVLVVIATTIVVTLWFTRPLLYRRRR